MLQQGKRSTPISNCTFKECYLIPLRFLAVTALLLYINNYLYLYFQLCEPEIKISIDLDYKETEEVLSDIGYAQALSAAKSNGPEEVSEFQRRQWYQLQKQGSERSKILLETQLLWEIQEVYTPQIVCPTMVRVGSVDKSEYVLCNPWLLAHSDRCIVYSIGVNGDVDFEKDLYDITNHNCDIFCFDEHQQNKRIFETFRGTFLKARISRQSSPTWSRYTILDLTKKFGHTKIDVLKMRLGGAELFALPMFLREFDGNVCQIVVELHGYPESTAKLWLPVIQMMERRGYRLFHQELNTFSPRFLIYSYIHVTCLTRFHLTSQSVMFTYFV